MRYLKISSERIEICVGQMISTPLIDMLERKREREREKACKKERLRVIEKKKRDCSDELERTL